MFRGHSKVPGRCRAQIPKQPVLARAGVCGVLLIGAEWGCFFRGWDISRVRDAWGGDGGLEWLLFGASPRVAFGGGCIGGCLLEAEGVGSEEQRPETWGTVF